ncbi:MAG: hypothetical protein K2H39_00935, partial [Paramuribaculum sp.]|nr:hypothetical protein [Paramuribaculum sp.]
MKRLSYIIVFFTAIAALTLSSKIMAKKPDITSPDFAFPAKVRTDANFRFVAAMKKGNDTEALRALVDAALAQAAVAPDSAGNQADRIEKFAHNCQNEAVASLAYLFCAKIYDDIY